MRDTSQLIDWMNLWGSKGSKFQVLEFLELVSFSWVSLGQFPFQNLESLW